MTTEELALVAIGAILNAGMFACGVLFGTSLRKDVRDDDDDQGTAENTTGWWHDASYGKPQTRVGRGFSGGSDPTRSASSSERAARQRRLYGN